MPGPSNDQPKDVPLNPDLRSRTDTTVDMTTSPAPVDTASAKEGQGEGWPIVWLVAFILCVAVAVYYLV